MRTCNPRTAVVTADLLIPLKTTEYSAVTIMEEHKLAVPLCALEVASSTLPTAGLSPPLGDLGNGLSALRKQQSMVAAAEACSDSFSSEIQMSGVPSPSLPVVSGVDLKGENSGQRSIVASSVGTRRNSSLVHADGCVTSTSPDGSYISSPFFSGSPMDFPDTLQPRALNIAADMQCSLSTPLEKFFDVLDSTDTPVATPSPLATVCTHHTTSPAVDAFPLNGTRAQEGDDQEKNRSCGHHAQVSSSDSLSAGSAFPIRPTENSHQETSNENHRGSYPASRRSSSHDEASRTTTCAGSSDAGMLDGGTLCEFPPAKATECASDGLPPSSTNRLAATHEKPVFTDDVSASQADRLLVDFQLLLILLFDQVCNVVPGLRRQDGGAFYSMHLQRIAAGPLHPTLASYADVLLPICSAMNFFSDGKGNESRGQKQEEQEGILSVALRYLARHGTIPAAPIAEMVAKCPAAVFIQVVSALECMYSLQRILAPGASESRDRVTAELDPKTIWGDAVSEMEKAASTLAEECVSSSLPPKGTAEEAPPLTPCPLAPDHSNRQPKRPRGAVESSSKRQTATVHSTVGQETESENRKSLPNPASAGIPLSDIKNATRSAPSNVTLPSVSVEGGIMAEARGELSPAFISASVNKRRHPSVQAEILNSCCPERLAQRGTRLLGEVLQKLQSEQALRPASIKAQSPKQVLSATPEPAEVAIRQQDATGAHFAEGESDSLSSGSARGKRKLSGAGEQPLGETFVQLAPPQQTSSSPPEMDEVQTDGPTDGQLKKHGYGLRKGIAKKGRKALEEGSTRSNSRLTPIKSQNPQQTRAKTTAPLSPSEGSQTDHGASLPPSLTEQLMRLAKGADGDFPAALSSTMRGVFFNRSLNRWVCTWSRNGKEYQRSWSAGMQNV